MPGTWTPCVRRASGAIEAVGRSGAGTPLGVIASAVYRPVAVALEPGDLVVLYTDGVTESIEPRPPAVWCRTIEERPGRGPARSRRGRRGHPGGRPRARRSADRNPTTSRSSASSAIGNDAFSRFTRTAPSRVKRPGVERLAGRYEEAVALGSAEADVGTNLGEHDQSDADAVGGKDVHTVAAGADPAGGRGLPGRRRACHRRTRQTHRLACPASGDIIVRRAPASFRTG